jgi:hypothetical protein
MGQRIRHWSCSKFADWIRGTPKISAGTGRQWKNWEKEAESKYPIRYWIAEEGLDAIQNFIWWPIDKLYDIKYYINNRWISRTHSLTAHPQDIKPGQWRDVGDRFLPCLFNELVDFVEVELAWWHLAWSPEERPKYNMPWWAVGGWRIRTWRCPQAGLDNLDWQRNLVWKVEEVGEDSDLLGKRTNQAERADEILALYKWWTEVYRNRPDSHDAGGWTAYCEQRRKNNGNGLGFFDMEDRSPEDAEQSRIALDRTQEIEKAYEDEDTEMMIRLIKIRKSLWT